jgi:hypothetical protein
MNSAAAVSTKFPEGYGDFVLRSQDGVLCSFPSTILRHASCVFKDMLALGPEEGSTSTTVAPVDVTESINTLELFLTHLDPNDIPPPIDPNTIEGLLQAAHKYQTSKILRWFEVEATVTRKNEATRTSHNALVISHPMLTLALAVQFDLVETIRIALREISGCHSNILSENTQQFTFPLYPAVLRLREQRLIRYENWIGVLANSETSEIVELLFMEKPRSKVTRDVPKFCMLCTAKRSEWILGMMKAVKQRPQWKSFIAAYDVEHRCGQCDRSWNDYFRSQLWDWSQEAKREEDKLPDWPM